MSFQVQNVLNNSLDFLDKFRDKVGNAYNAVEDQIERKPWGGYGVKRQEVSSPSSGERFPSTEPVKDFMKKDIGEKVARTTAGVLFTDDAAKTIRKKTNIPMQLQDAANNIPAKVGIRSDDNPLAAAVIAKGAPYLAAYLSGSVGSPATGFRPKGEKAVYPKSKEEDPTGREVGNPLAEVIGRSVFFQRGQLLPYGEFKKERPDVMPSTYRDYMAYQYAKPEAGSLVTIDPQRGSFTAFGGAVKGSAKGLNDPEVRVKGLKATASQLAGLAVGRYAMGKTGEFLGARNKGTQYDTNPGNTFVPTVSVDTSMVDVMRTGEKVKDFAARKADTPAGRQKLEDAVRASRAKQLTAYAKDIEDDYSSMNRGLKQGTKITKDRLQSVQATTDRSVLPRSKGGRNVNPTEFLSGTTDDGVTPGLAPRMTQSSKEIKGNKIVDSGPKPYNEFRVGIKKEGDPSKRALLQQAIDQSKQESQRRIKVGLAESKIKTTGQKIEDFLGGSQYRPALQIAAGTAAALGTAYAIKKTVQKVNERRAKKQDPVEYLKYKHGDFASAKEALKQPTARGYQDLVPYVK
jgi:hypothetical protein